jgi:hypothetical protein
VNIGLLLALATKRIYSLYCSFCLLLDVVSLSLCYVIVSSQQHSWPRVLKCRVQMGYGVSTLARPNLHNLKEQKLC